MTEPMTDAEIEALRTMPFTTGMRAYTGEFVDDQERDLYRLAALNHNAKLQLVAELVRTRAELAAAHDATSEALAHSDATCEAVAERDRLRAEVAELRERDDWLRSLEAAGVDNWDGCSYAAEIHEREA